MGILRTDIVSHSQLTSANASVLFNGGTGSAGDTGLRTADGDNGYKIGTSSESMTIECWIYHQEATTFNTIWATNNYGVSGNAAILYAHNNGLYASITGFASDGDFTNCIETGKWHHIASVKEGSQWRFYVDGEIIGYRETTSEISEDQLTIGSSNYGGNYPHWSMHGYISNFRVNKRALYKENFTPSKFKLKNIAGTTLLCCQDASDDTTAAVGSIAAGGTPVPGGFGPDLKEDTTDTGVVFEDNTKFDTLSYMIPPGGTTAESNRGRAVFAGGYDAQPGRGQWMKYLSIQSGGLTTEFGEMLAATDSNAGTGNATRGLIIGGDTAPTNLTDTIQYITIATTSNATDFGNTSSARRLVGALANNTRAVYGGGTAAPVGSDLNEIEYITIATTGNATDFGDLSITLDATSALSSPTRGVFIQGINPAGARLNVMEYITIASTGNAADFGDTTAVGIRPSTGSSSTRGVYAGGDTASGDTNETNVIGYITIATTGNATDFGDLVLAVTSPANGQACSPTRMLVSGGNAPGASYNNIIQMITIETTGNAVDWGDLTEKTVFSGAAMSDSHGGIS